MNLERIPGWTWPWRTRLRDEPRSERRRVRIGGAVISYEVAGEGRPIVLIHGLGASGRWWSRNVPTLARHFRVYAIDVIGFGRSGGQEFVLDLASSHLVAWMDAIGVERATVVGHSMGGYIAADLAADHPRRVDKLVLVNAAALPFEVSYQTHLRNSVRGLRYVSPRVLPLAVLDSFRAGALTLLGGIRQILAADLTEKLARIEAPTLVVWGAEDPLIPASAGERLSLALKNGSFARMEGAAHNPMWDQPTMFNELLIEFMDRPTPPPRARARAARTTPAPGGRSARA
jgi:pimeloyl-ACP methyl ester carboxylesterase